jgi:membrane protein implicated in regulation of membrane protease activity
VILVVAILLAVFVVPSPWSIVVVVVGCVLEVGEIALLRRWSKRIGRRTKATTGAEAMVGKAAEVTQDCRPTGMVRLDGELWEARCDGGASRGDSVVVERLDGLTLVVARAKGPGPD